MRNTLLGKVSFLSHHAELNLLLDWGHALANRLLVNVNILVAHEFEAYLLS